MKNYTTIVKKLQDAYKKWIAQLKEKHPQFLEDGFSNPYYVGVQENWCDCEIKILIVGQEGYFSNNSGNGKKASLSNGKFYDKVKYDDCETLMAWATDCLNKQLLKDYKSKFDYRVKRTSFWKWARFLKSSFHNASFAWTELDKICKENSGSGCSLKTSQEQDLHSLETKILQEEISILKPDLVVFLGWYSTSLKLELPGIFDALEEQRETWTHEKMTVLDNEEVTILFSYHPSWLTRNKKNEDYFNKFKQLIEKIKETKS